MKKSLILVKQIENQPTQTSSQFHDQKPNIQQKLIAQWVLDEHSQLHCQWVAE